MHAWSFQPDNIISVNRTNKIKVVRVFFLYFLLNFPLTVSSFILVSISLSISASVFSILSGRLVNGTAFARTGQSGTRGAPVTASYKQKCIGYVKGLTKALKNHE